MANLAGGAVTASHGTTNRFMRRLSLAGDGVAVQTIAADVTVTVQHEEMIILDGGVATRVVTLPTVAAGARKGMLHILRNAGTTNDLTIARPSPVTLATLVPGTFCIVVHDGTVWRLAASGTAIDTAVHVSTPSGTGASGATAPEFTGTAATAAEINAFTGSGYATAGQVVTTTDNQTMTLNQCAGMWLITATKPPCLIASNTAVAGAPAVLTVYGAAPATTAEGYRILAAPTPVGTVASHTHTGPSHTH